MPALEVGIVAGMVGLLLADRFLGRSASSRVPASDTTGRPRRRKRPISRAAKRLAARARRRDLDELARQLERGEIRGEALKELMASGELRVQRKTTG